MSRRYSVVARLALAALACVPLAGFALDGQITQISGAVLARSADGQSRLLALSSAVREGDLLVTADNAFARIRWGDGGEIVLRANTQLTVNAYDYEESAPGRDNVLLTLIKGGFRSATGFLTRRNPQAHTVTTPTANIGIRGTHFGALFCNNDCANIPAPSGGAPANGLHVDVADGRIIVVTRAGAMEFAVGQFGYVQSEDSAPVQVPESRAIRVTLPPQAANPAIQGGTVGTGHHLECTIR
jgi:hypothetical protein